ncbi:MAG: fumarylacetoacetate hydrolase family protein [Pseudomonadota bacterium]
MKLCRFGEAGAEKPGLIDHNGELRDLSGQVDDIAHEVLSDASLDTLRKLDVTALPKVEGDVRFGPCVAGIGKFMCIGLNYSDHAAETGADIPEHPILFMKATSAVVGPDDDVVLPRGSERSDWEVELGVVIGKACKYVSEEEALDYVAGYCIVNDVSERHFQTKLTGQWTKGKSCDTFGPTGPWLVTRDEVGDPQNLAMSLDLNGERVQTGNTSTMIFTVAQCISHLSQMFTLHPGDVISTGTPPGVGMGMKPPLYLKAGDVMELEIAGLGRQRQEVRMDAPAEASE